MVNPPRITENDIRARVTEQSYDRGVDYYQSGTVESATLRGNQLFAEVQGSGWDPYAIGDTFTDNDITASCTCPYAWGGYCKHVVATLLAVIDQDTHVPVGMEPTVADVIAGMDAASLRALVCLPVDADPASAEIVDAFSEGGLT